MNWQSPSGKTWIGPEEDAYSSPTGNQWGSNRKARVLCPDGTIRAATLGIPDTFISIPGHIRLQGKTITGWVGRAPAFHIGPAPEFAVIAHDDADEWIFHPDVPPTPENATATIAATKGIA